MAHKTLLFWHKSFKKVPNLVILSIVILLYLVLVSLYKILLNLLHSSYHQKSIFKIMILLSRPKIVKYFFLYLNSSQQVSEFKYKALWSICIGTRTEWLMTEWLMTEWLMTERLMTERLMTKRLMTERLITEQLMWLKD